MAHHFRDSYRHLDPRELRERHRQLGEWCGQGRPGWLCVPAGGHHLDTSIWKDGPENTMQRKDLHPTPAGLCRKPEGQSSFETLSWGATRHCPGPERPLPMKGGAPWLQRYLSWGT